MGSEVRNGSALEAASAIRLSSVAACVRQDDPRERLQDPALQPYGGVVYALELLGIPSAVIRTDRTILAANGLLRRLIPRVVLQAQGRLGISCPGADWALGAALCAGGAAAAVIRIAAHEHRPPMLAHLMAGAAGTPPLDGALVLALTPLARPTPPDTGQLGYTLALTACEARVAHGLAAGNTVEEIARNWGVSAATVRTQLKSVLAKTGARRQSDLVALVCGVALKRG